MMSSTSGTPSPINAESPPISVDSPPINVESPESHSSTYSTVYSPAASSSTASNIDTDCCRNVVKAEPDCCRNVIKVRRQRLRPWLINQINSGEIPGLVWLDKENMIFKIPWKHFGRPGVDMYLDALLFRRWALHTKKFEQGRPSDISTWKTRFRCALHKLPDIEELNEMNQTEGDEPYRVYKFKKIEVEKVTCTVAGSEMNERKSNALVIIVNNDEPESSIGSVGSPVSASYPVEPTVMINGSNNYRAPVTTVYAGVYPKQEIMDTHGAYPRKRYLHKPKPAGLATTDIHKWQYYEQMRYRDAYPDDKSNVPTSDEFGYDDEDDISRKAQTGKAKEERRYQVMDYETDDDDMSWNSRGCIQVNRNTPSIPSVTPRHTVYYTDGTPVQRAFEPVQRQYSSESNEVGVIKNLKLAQKRTNPDSKDLIFVEDDDNDLFFQSCAKRIKKLDTRSNGYLKLKISELFYFVENSQQNFYNQSYRYRTDPPPLISNANVRKTEQNMDDSMQQSVK